MGRLSNAAVIGLALSCFAGDAWAQNACVRAQDLTALQIAAVQQELMVAALTCDDVTLYNGFVVAYRKDLKASDDALQAFFRRRDATTGTSDYHAFKTKMANAYSVRSADNKSAYCKNAQDLFHAAQGGKQSLSAFALAQPISVDKSYATCGTSVEGGATVAGASANLARVRDIAPTARHVENDGSPSAVSPSVGVAPLIAAAPPEPPVPSPYSPAPDMRDDYVPPPAYTPEDRAQRDTRPPSNWDGDRYARGNDEEYQAPDRRRPSYQDRFTPPPAPPYPYDSRTAYAYARGLYGRAGGGYYDRNYSGYPPYRDSYGRYWYGVPPQYYLWRR